ncbi:putative nuclease HARBI1 [Phlebotomus papatasi]|uniref:putative nuclease HARBI1 n=1 Tax=Phlebotomus papatasi TaxID=29031 RepID=UPI0024840E5E|nr:putative nuclease HARBI1 [Phlebotomus papatasi]
MAFEGLVNLLMLEAIINEEDNATREHNTNRDTIRRRQLALDPPNRRFMELFRITKEVFGEIMMLVETDIRAPSRVSAYPKETQVLVILRWLAIGDYQRPIGEEMLLGVSQSGVCRIIQSVLPILERKLCSQYIKWPTSSEERRIIQDGFLSKYGISSTMGGMDGTQVALCRPEHEHLYLNRHEIHSMNVSLICDHEQKFIAVDATHPGATHDAAIWNTSEERKFMQEIYNRGERMWLLGDSGYPLEPWLITPYRSPTDRLQTEFNHKFSRIRTIIENTIDYVWLCTAFSVLCFAVTVTVTAQGLGVEARGESCWVSEDSEGGALLPCAWKSQSLLAGS